MISMLISTEQLQQNLHDVNALIIDSRSYKEYSRGHIPGAVNLDLFAFHWFDTSEKGITSFNEQMRKILSFAGIDENKKIIFYDNVSGMLAARGVWLCLYFSHHDVYMLDGGLKKWAADNFELETKSNPFSPSNLKSPIDSAIIIGFDDLRDNLGKAIIIDARSPDEFNGVVSRAAREGHIPSAINLDWVENLDKVGTLKSDKELLSLYQFEKNSNIITYCQGAYRAANSFLALKKLGFKNVKVYLGSWGEWGNRLDLPVEN
jgi:thiosulfate/3-mercaptopyruvate sulfurtransferase